ncbi:MAG: cysteine desulfurase [Chloroflexota bacterium]
MSDLNTKQFDVQSIRGDFPILHQEISPGVPLVYLDNAASSQKPIQVIDAISNHYRRTNANIHRGIHRLSEQSTVAYEQARDKARSLINAKHTEEIIFTRNATEAINLVAWSWGNSNLAEGDEIVVTELEHHSNLVPWQLLCDRTGAKLKYIPLKPDAQLDLSKLDSTIGPRTKLAAISGMSNVVGSVYGVHRIIAKARSVGSLVLADGAQSVPHTAVDVQDLDCDFMAFSGHKMCGPTGIGVLYAKRQVLESMSPFLGGGDMISRVSMEGSVWNDLPWRFEAGTPAIAQAIGLGAAIDYLTDIGMENIHHYEDQIGNYARQALVSLPGISFVSPDVENSGATISFTVEGVHPHDVAEIVNRDGVAIRAGHHCAMPLHRKLGLAASCRASMYFYNTFEEVDKLVSALRKAQKIFGVA